MDLTGGWTVPQILIDGRPIGGYTELVRLDATGGSTSCAPRRASLARRAVRRAAAADDDPLDRRAAAVARLAGAAVDLELVLHPARLRRPAAR